MLRQRMDRVPGDIVISARFQQTVMWGAFIVILFLGLVESLYAQSTSTGKTQASVFFGVFIALCALLWLLSTRRPPHRQVPGQEIRYWARGGNLSFMLSRSEPGVTGPPVVCLLPPRRE